MVFGLQSRDDAIDDVVGVGGFLGGAGNDERRARLVDQNRIDLVHDREVVRALDVVLEIELHVVAQVIEAELVVLAVGDVARIGSFAIGVAHAVHDDADAQPEEAVDAAHPFGVAPREVIVHRNDMHTAPGQRVKHRRQRRHQRLALAGLHLGDPAAMQNHPAD